MIQKRKVRSLNWFVKNCKLILDSFDNDAYLYAHSNWMFVNDMFIFCGKVVIWNDNIFKINGSIRHWEEWMFEPLGENNG